MKRWHLVPLLLLLLAPALLFGATACGAHTENRWAATGTTGHSHGNHGKSKPHTECMTAELLVLDGAGEAVKQPTRVFSPVALYSVVSHDRFAHVPSVRSVGRFQLATAPPIWLTTLRLRV